MTESRCPECGLPVVRVGGRRWDQLFPGELVLHGCEAMIVCEIPR